MSKTSFRSRNIDPDRPIPIYHIDELTDLNDYAAVSRSIIQMPTGMEKEEESEQHFQIAMEAQALYGATGELAIPVPEVSIAESPKYPSERKYIPSKSYFKQSLNFQENIQRYDIDSDDEKWLKNVYSKHAIRIEKAEFENCLDKLEWLRKIQPNELKLSSIESFINLPVRTSSLIFEYWKHKRKDLHANYSLCPEVRTEQIDGANSHDPYVAFRKRFEKMQTRKNRKFEEQLFERLIRTHINIANSEYLFKNITNREQLKLKYQQSIKDLFRCRQILNDHKSKKFHNALSQHYKDKITDSDILSGFIGTGVIEFDCSIHSRSEWRLPKDLFTSNNKLSISSFIRRINPKAFVKNLTEPKRKTPFSVDLYRDKFGNLVRYRCSRSGQIVRDFVSEMQSANINILDETVVNPSQMSTPLISQQSQEDNDIIDTPLCSYTLLDKNSDSKFDHPTSKYLTNGRCGEDSFVNKDVGVTFVVHDQL